MEKCYKVRMIVEVEQVIEAHDKLEAIRKARRAIENKNFEVSRYRLDERFKIREIDE